MTGTVTKAKILRDDIKFWDGKTLTATRTDSTGGTITSEAIGNTVDVLTVYGDGENFTRATVQKAIDAVGSSDVTFEFTPGTWIIDTNTTIPANISVYLPAGAVFSIANGVTLTIAGPYHFAGQSHITGAGTFTPTGPRAQYAAIWNVEDEGDGTINSANTQAALDKCNTNGGGLVRITKPGTHTSFDAQITIGSNTTFEIGPGVVIKLAASVNAHFITNKDTINGNIDITIKGGGTIDGNSANQDQTDDATKMGVRLVKVTDGTLMDFTIQNVHSHAVFLSDCDHCAVINVTAKNNGIPGNTTAGGGLYDSGNCTYIRWIGCNSRSNETGGYKSAEGDRITYIGCASDGNGGNGYNLDFDSPGESIRWVGCESNNNGGIGFNIGPGANHNMALIGCSARNNGEAGCYIGNGAYDIEITGCEFSNNGTLNDAPGADQGRDGITIKGSGAAMHDISIVGCHFFDDAGQPTQDHGVSIQGSGGPNDPYNVIVDACRFGAHEDGAIFITANNSSVESNIRVGASNIGLNYTHRESDNTITASAAETDLSSTSLTADELGIKQMLRIIVAGELQGTTDTKDIRFYVGSTATVIISAGAAVDNDWSANLWLYRFNATQGLLIVQSFLGNAVEIQSVALITEDFSSAITLKTTGQIGGTTDTINERVFKMFPID